MLLDSRQRRLKVHNRNRLYEDPMAEYKELQMVNIWNKGEKRVFRERFFQHPKNFSFIASALDRKVTLPLRGLCLYTILFAFYLQFYKHVK